MYWLKPRLYRCSINVGGVGVLLAYTLSVCGSGTLSLLGGGCLNVVNLVISVIQVDANGALTGFDAKPSSTLELYYLQCSRTCCARPKH